MSNKGSKREAARRQWDAESVEHDARHGLTGVDYLAGAIERLGGVKKAAKRLTSTDHRKIGSVTPTMIENWLAEGVSRAKSGHILNLSYASGVPHDLLRFSPYRGRSLEREDLLAATQRAI